MKTLVREYTDEKNLVEDVKELKELGVAQNNIYVLAHQDDRTEYVAEEANINRIGIEELGLAESLHTLFEHKGDELRTKIEEMGLTRQDAEIYEEKLDEGKLLLFVTDSNKLNGMFE
ncbi:general stress protein [Litchfieldia alkalitelluris]|uniref:general stress protein n=1 Tax=Litchfieldia alkalitelluris TaxID=304268 RepID=UPI000995E8A8|nr:general stress protein [Litchfieldia alkalitelluris]